MPMDLLIQELTKNNDCNHFIQAYQQEYKKVYDQFYLSHSWGTVPMQTIKEKVGIILWCYPEHIIYQIGKPIIDEYIKNRIQYDKTVGVTNTHPSWLNRIDAVKSGQQ